jgi:hypothetical protein
VQFERVLYSAPFTLAGKLLWLRATAAAVTLFKDYRHVATHARGRRPGQRATVREHLPPEARAFFGRGRAWCATQAQAIGTSRSTEIMFGGKRLGTQHDFPSGLDTFALRTEAQLGSAVEIARDRTMLRFYRPFLANAEIDYAIWAMRGPAVAHLEFRLGLLTSRFRANHPLKACVACMQTDLTGHGCRR